MMMVQVFLILHIVGAGVVGVLIVSALVAVLRHQSNFYKPFASSIAFGTGLQLITGSLFALNQPHVSLFNFCSKIGLYLGAVLFVEFLLYKRMQEDRLVIYPVKVVALSLLFGMTSVFFTILSL